MGSDITPLPNTITNHTLQQCFKSVEAFGNYYCQLSERALIGMQKVGNWRTRRLLNGDMGKLKVRLGLWKDGIQLLEPIVCEYLHDLTELPSSEATSPVAPADETGPSTDGKDISTPPSTGPRKLLMNALDIDWLECLAKCFRESNMHLEYVVAMLSLLQHGTYMPDDLVRFYTKELVEYSKNPSEKIEVPLSRFSRLSIQQDQRSPAVDSSESATHVNLKSRGDGRSLLLNWRMNWNLSFDSSYVIAFGPQGQETIFETVFRGSTASVISPGFHNFDLQIADDTPPGMYTFGAFVITLGQVVLSWDWVRLAQKELIHIREKSSAGVGAWGRVTHVHLNKDSSLLESKLNQELLIHVWSRSTVLAPDWFLKVNGIRIAEDSPITTLNMRDPYFISNNSDLMEEDAISSDVEVKREAEGKLVCAQSIPRGSWLFIRVPVIVDDFSKIVSCNFIYQ